MKIINLNQEKKDKYMSQKEVMFGEIFKKSGKLTEPRANKTGVLAI